MLNKLMVTFSENSTKQDEFILTETIEVDKGKDGESGGSSHDAFSASKTKRVRLSDGVKGKTLCADFFCTEISWWIKIRACLGVV